MSDDESELLKLAAKAAGIEVIRIDPQGLWIAGGLGVHWNPLENNGEALRLAIKLRLDLTVFRDHVTAFHATDWCDELNYDDPERAARRAIVRAAAAVGEIAA